MPIQRIHVENFKSFSELDIELSRFNVVIGSNAAGKSNFISIFKFLRDIAKHGVVNAIAMQGGSEYLQNTKIGPLKDLHIKVVFLPDQKSEILGRQGQDTSFLAIQSCQSSYEFALRFAPRGDGFSVIKDRIILGCEVLSCRYENDHSIEKKNRGRGEIRVTNDGGKITYEIDLPEGCPLSEQDIIPLVYGGNTCLKKHSFWKLRTHIRYPLVKNSLIVLLSMISTQNS